MPPNAIAVRRPAIVDPEVVAQRPTKLGEPLHERPEPGLRLRIVGGEVHKHPDAAHPFALLPPRHKWPCGSCAAEQRDEFAAAHSITSSASNCIELGTSTPTALEVCA